MTGPNSSLRVYRSRDQGKTFRLQAIVPAPVDRDIRDPSFFAVGKRLHIKAITRLPGFALRDKDAGSISVDLSSKDGRSWTRPRPIGPIGWGFWRVVERLYPGWPVARERLELAGAALPILKETR